MPARNAAAAGAAVSLSSFDSKKETSPPELPPSRGCLVDMRERRTDNKLAVVDLDPELPACSLTLIPYPSPAV